jgi:putative adenylate-forming enzyme
MNISLLMRLLWTLRRLRQRDHWTRSQLELHQVESLRRLREHAYARSPFYQRFHRGLAGRPLSELPVLTKATVMEHFDDLVTDRALRLSALRAHAVSASENDLFLGRYRVCVTSGSTGRPGLFVFDRREWTTVLASFARAQEWAGLKVTLARRVRMASVASAAPRHMSAQVAASLRSWWLPALRLEADAPVEATVERLNTWQPETLVTYASSARILADEQLSGRLRIAPRMVFTSSEVLTEETRHRVEAAWGCPPFNEYAASECGSLAAECTRRRGLHACDDLAIFEVVDERNQPVPPGTYGERLLVTVLFNRTQPLIRYELSDSLCLATEPCPCGRPFTLVGGIQGRAADVLHLPAAGGGEVAVHPLTFHRVLDAVPASGWQVVQENGGLTVLLSGVASGLVDELLSEKLTRALAARGVRLPRIAVQRVAAIPRGAAGKASLIRTKHR